MLGSPPESGRSEGRITSPQLASKFGKARVRFGSKPAARAGPETSRSGSGWVRAGKQTFPTAAESPTQKLAESAFGRARSAATVRTLDVASVWTGSWSQNPAWAAGGPERLSVDIELEW